MVLGAEDAVACVAQAGQDIAVLVELAVDRRGVHRHVGMRIVERADALGARHQADEPDRARARLLQPVDGGDRRVAGREHRVEHDRVALAHAARHLEVVLDGHERLRIAVEADVAYARTRHDVEEAVEQPGAGAQDRHEHELLAVDQSALHRLERRLDLHVVHRHVARDLVGH
jgi:hypothetical protein